MEQYKKSKVSISLTTDYNFYSLFFIFSLLFEFYLIYKNQVHKTSKEFIFVWIFIINIFLSGSRRAVIVLLLLLGVSIFFLFHSKRKRNIFLYKVITSTQIIAVFMVFTFSILVIFRNYIIIKTKQRNNITQLSYRYASFFNKNISYFDFYNILWTIDTEYKHNVYKNY
ncbi:MAG: hypothetical protein L3J74_14095, partial [Bacteroidales bacterium]|nr:hypothetical protein [Bacteroidales bacterium]